MHHPRSLYRYITALLLMSMAASVRAEEFVAIVDLKFIQTTELTAVVQCFGDKEEDCDVWATLYVFEATVRKKIKGEPPAKKFRVLYGHHALPEADIRGVVALVHKMECEDEKNCDRSAGGGAEYQLKWGESRKLYCFDGSAETADIKGDQVSCFEKAED